MGRPATVLRVCAGVLVGVLALMTMGPTGAASTGSAAAPASMRSTATGPLPPEFTGTLKVSFDVTALESDSDLTPGNYDQSHLTGKVTLRPKQGATSQLFDGNLFSATPSLDATSTVTLFAAGGPCQNHTFTYAPATGYPSFPTYFSLTTPELAQVFGHRWTLFLGSLVAAQSNGCPGQDGNWPIEHYQDYIADLFQTAWLPDADSSGGRRHLVGSRTLDMTYAPVARHNKAACAADGVYYDPCFTSWNVTLSYDLQRISPDRVASQYPKLTLTNNARGNDVVVVHTDTAVRHDRVVLERIVPGRLVMRSVGPNPMMTNRKGVLRLTLKDRKKNGRRWFLAYVDGTSRVLPGMSPTRSIK